MHAQAAELNRVRQLIRKEILADGLLGEMLAHCFERSGKLLRPWFAILSARSIKGTASGLIPTATALELIHVASLVHDDIMDKSTLRRGLPTVHTRFGASEALLLGDWLLARAFELMQQVEREEMRTLFARLTRELCEGQLLELECSRSGSINLSRYYRLIELKTASMFEAACRLGALANLDSTSREVEALSGFGLKFGLFFQIADDLMDLVSTEEESGKDCGLDISNQVRTMPVLKGLELEGSRKPLSRLLESQNASRIQSELPEILQRIGAIEATWMEARTQVRSALTEIEDLKLPELLACFENVARAIGQKAGIPQVLEKF